MKIAANTKISAILKANPDAIEVIASINRHFEKLRNPLLRKILASRVTIADAARIGGCTEEEFYKRLEPLGFNLKVADITPAEHLITAKEKPVYLKQLSETNILLLDVREDISTGNDPFLKIMEVVETLNTTNALLLINTFEPTPLMEILQKRGYASFAEEISDDLVHTYFWLNGSGQAEAIGNELPQDFDSKVNAYERKLRHLDVRHLEMPQPMVAILNELEKLPTEEALYVTHKKVPQFLLPKLQERGFALALKEFGPAEVHLLIYKGT